MKVMLLDCGNLGSSGISLVFELSNSKPCASNISAEAILVMEDMVREFQSAKSEALEVKVFPIDNPIGSAKDAYLRLRGRMFRATILEHEHRRKVEVGGNSLNGISVSTTLPIPTHGTVILMEIFGRDATPPPDCVVLLAGLVLLPTGNEKGTYYRGGTFYIGLKYLRVYDLTREGQLGTVSLFDEAFRSCGVGLEEFQEFDGKERYTVKII
ncbi:hypothetical protein GQ53DRAFT_823711 [Thozetella sp. PMI_491]|nr:hypothetical protein GQ53DRAFT_823711 [Thozetella sp. PMI_491]